MIKRVCEARQYSDQTICTYCNMTWDTNDSHPPKCKTGVELFQYIKEKIKWLNKRKKLK